MKIKVAINQFKIGANKVENIKKAKEFIMKSILSESNIIVLPECFVCPYDVNVFNVDCTLPLPLSSNVVLEFVVNGDPLELVILLPFVSSIIFLCAELLSKLKLPEILSDNLKNCIGSLVLSPALVFKLPLELTSVNPTFDINGIAIHHLVFN